MSLAFHYWMRCISLLRAFRLRNDLYCVKWDVKLYHTILSPRLCRKNSCKMADLLMGLLLLNAGDNPLEINPPEKTPQTVTPPEMNPPSWCAYPGDNPPWVNNHARPSGDEPRQLMCIPRRNLLLSTCKTIG